MVAFPVHEIIILGAGPAGISVAVEAVNKGIKPDNILVLEKSHEILHMISKKYPPEKPVLANYKGKSVSKEATLSIGDMTKSEFLKYMNDMVINLGIKVAFNSQAHRIVKLRNGQLQVCTESECYIGNSVFIAIGSMSAPRKLMAKIEPGTLERIHTDIQNIAKDMTQVLVVGGGDSAAEYAMILKNRGHNVTLSYRGSDFQKMIETNSQALHQMISKNQITYLANSEVDSISSKENFLYVRFKNGDQKYFDSIITALGTDRPSNYLKAIGIQLCYEGKEIYSESSLAGVFAIGDLASNSGGTINLAFNSGAKAFSEAFHYYLSNT